AFLAGDRRGPHRRRCADGTEPERSRSAPGERQQHDIRKIGLFALDGKVDAQPLLVPGVTIPGQGVHDVVYAATERGTIYGLDAMGCFWSEKFMLMPGRSAAV